MCYASKILAVMATPVMVAGPGQSGKHITWEGLLCGSKAKSKICPLAGNLTILKGDHDYAEPDGARNHFPDEGENGWTRKIAGEVKDFLEYHYGLKRQNIKFE